MKKLSLFTGAMLIVALALISGLSTPEPAWAVCLCQSFNDSATDLHWGMGSSCTAAHDSLVSQTAQAANTACGGAFKTCLGNVVITGQCHFDHGVFIEDGYREYSCKVCEPPTP